MVGYTALLQEIAVTAVSNSVRIYDAKGVSELSMSRSELMESLVEAFRSQRRQLEGSSVRVPDSGNETTWLSSVSHII